MINKRKIEVWVSSGEFESMVFETFVVNDIPGKESIRWSADKPDRVIIVNYRDGADETGQTVALINNPVLVFDEAFVEGDELGFDT